MLSDDDHPGIFTFMVGVIVVVLAGVGLSLLIDLKFTFSKSISSTEKGLKTSAAEIVDLKSEIDEASRKLSAQEPSLRATAANLATARNRLNADIQRSAKLTEIRNHLKETIPALENEFSKYREAYRVHARAAAVGQPLGTLIIRGGREYRQVVIKEITDVGMEIRHEHGIARVQAPDLDQSFQDKFQWNDEERRNKLNEEHVMSEAITANTVENRPESPPIRGGAANPDDTKVATLRTKVIHWKSKVSLLNSEHSAAVSSASYGSKSSVPGSLETWQAKASRLASELAKARGELAAAKAALGLVSPNDPLLRPDPVGN